MSYREQFFSADAARFYDERQYKRGSYSDVLWSIEREQLDVVLGDRADFDYLDFACGTGRVLRHVTARASSARGIEISLAMAERARVTAPNALIECRDITATGSSVEGRYDVITAFRFFLNAEPTLRRAALQQLRDRLRGPQSILILNNHGNLVSHKAIFALPHWVKKRGRRLQEGNLMSHRSVLRLARDAGIEISREAGCGFLGGRLAALLPERSVRRFERWFARSRISWLGSNQLYIARLKSFDG